MSVVVNPAVVVTPPVVNTAGRVLIDIGTNNDWLTSFKDSRGKTWNVVNDVNPWLRISNALDINNVATTLWLSMFTKLYGDFYGVWWNGDGTNRVWSSTDIGDYPILAVQDSAFIDNTLTSNGQWKITWLDPKKVYSFKFRWARYGDAQTIRWLKMKLSSETTWKSVSQTNNSNPANAITFNTISGVTEVTFDIRVQDWAKFWYINLIDITYK